MLDLFDFGIIHKVTCILQESLCRIHCGLMMFLWYCRALQMTCSFLFFLFNYETYIHSVTHLGCKHTLVYLDFDQWEYETQESLLSGAKQLLNTNFT